MPGTFPYITSAEPTWTIANTAAPVASHAFTAPGLENPAMLTAIPVAWCSRPYNPSVRATRHPMRLGTTRILASPSTALAGWGGGGGGVYAGGPEYAVI